MKIIYEIKNSDEFLSQLNTIAQKYSTNVREHDEGPGHFVFVKSKIKISEKIRGNKKFAYVWGATDEDISYLNSFWGEPHQIIELKMTPLEFASELLDLPQTVEITKEDIIQSLGITSKDFDNYSRTIKRISGKPSSSEDLKNAGAILERL
jgi:hypothetical protein